MKRICLYAGYNPDGRIADYVIRQLEALAAVADVCCCYDCPLDEAEAAKIKPFCKIILSGRHNRYDFGSWQKLINELGWDNISAYDWLLICNDSCFGPFYSLNDTFQNMENGDCDFWGMTASREHNFHLQSYFIAFNRKITFNPVFRQFWSSIETQNDVGGVIRNYELRLTQLLTNENFRCRALVDDKSGANPTFRPFTLLKKHHLPFIKVKCFTKPDCHLDESLPGWENFLRHIGSYPPELIIRHCLSLGTDCQKRLAEEMPRIAAVGQFRLPGIFSMQINRKLCLKIKLFGFTICKKSLTLAPARQRKDLIEKLNHVFKT